MTPEKPNDGIPTLVVHGLIFDSERELRIYEEGVRAGQPSDEAKGERPNKATMIAAAIRGLR